MIDLLYCTFNRLEFTKASIETVLANTDWSVVRMVRAHDDGSTDGTKEFMESVDWPVRSEFITDRVGGPVAIMNRFIQDHRPGTFAKLDNDVLVPPHWLSDCIGVLNNHPQLDLLGIECGSDFPQPGPWPRTFQKVNHIGGIGLFQGRAFAKYGLPLADGRMGFTKWQESNEGVIKGWVKPYLPVALLDHLPMEPWRSLSEAYIAKGWQRRGWGDGPEQYYQMKSARLWEWWNGAKQEVAA